MVLGGTVGAVNPSTFSPSLPTSGPLFFFSCAQVPGETLSVCLALLLVALDTMVAETGTGIRGPRQCRVTLSAIASDGAHVECS
jgi:hypothetical protein